MLSLLKIGKADDLWLRANTLGAAERIIRQDPVQMRHIDALPAEQNMTV